MRLRRKRGRWLRAVWLALALVGCGPGDGGSAPGSDGSEAPGAEAEEGAAAAGPAAEIVRAPTERESEQVCPEEPADAATLDALLEEGPFEALEAHFVARQRAWQQQPACEVYFTRDADYLTGSGRLPVLDRLVEAHPDSWVARALRGTAHMDQGWRARGHALARDVTKEQWAAMHAAFDAARRDLWRSLELAPDNAFAPWALLEIAKVGGSSEEALEVLAHVIEHQPLNHRAWLRAVKAFDPRWGGSIAEMFAVAAEARPFLDRNPRLRMLPGYAEAALGAEHGRAGRDEEAAAAYERALRHGSHRDWWWQLCDHAWDAQQYDRVLRAAEGWLADFGDQSRAYLWRGKVLWKRRDLAAARRDLDRAFDLSPRNRFVASTRGQFLEAIGERVLAAEAYRGVLEHHPRDSWTLRRLALLLASEPEPGDAAERALRRWLEVAPREPEAWFQLGALLQRLGRPDAEETLRHYLALAEGDGDESLRIARARRLLDPPHARRLPALSLLGLDAAAGSGADS